MNQLPQRLHRTRVKGYRLPENSVYVARPGKFGNPFETAAQFRDVLSLMVAKQEFEIKNCNLIRFLKMLQIVEGLEELRGKDLACWCAPGKPCHASVLIEFANR